MKEAGGLVNPLVSTRRNFLLGGLGLACGGVAGGYGARDRFFKPEGDDAHVNNYFERRGFPNRQIKKDRFQELCPDFYSLPLRRDEGLEVNIVNDQEVLAEVYFDISGDELIALEIRDENNSPGKLGVVEVQFGDIQFQGVIVGTEHNQSANIDLGMVSGSSYLRIVRTPASKDTKIPFNGIALNRVQGGALYKAAGQCAPMLGMRRDNYLNFMNSDQQKVQEAALTNDMLLDCPVEIRENDNGNIALIYWGLYSAEDGGMGRNPIELYNKYHRVYDLDIAQSVILNNSFQILEIAHQEDNGNGSHQMVVDFTSVDGVAPFSQDLHSVPNHGMVGGGLEVVNGEEITKVWRPYPKIDLLMSDVQRDDMQWGARVVALTENIAEIKSKLNSLSKQPQMFEFLTASGLEDTKEFLEDRLSLELNNLK